MNRGSLSNAIFGYGKKSAVSELFVAKLVCGKNYFLKKNSNPDSLIITGTKITNTAHFLWNGSPKIQFFTNIWHSFCKDC
jgi:hypothetical protein